MPRTVDDHVLGHRAFVAEAGWCDAELGRAAAVVLETPPRTEVADAAAPPGPPVHRDRRSLGDARDAGTDFGDHTGTFVPECHRQGIRESFFGKVEHEVVGMACACRAHLEEDLSGTGRGFVDLAQLWGGLPGLTT